jgi:hypothetical protein
MIRALFDVEPSGSIKPYSLLIFQELPTFPRKPGTTELVELKR